MNLIKGLLVATGLGLLWKGSQVKGFLDQLTWTFRNVHLDFNSSLMSGFSRIYLTLNITFSNNTNFSMQVNRIVCAVSYNGYPVGVIDQAIPFQIEAQTPEDLSLPVVIQVDQASAILTELINDLRSLANMTEIMQFNFKGHLETAVGSFNFDETKILRISE